MKTFFVLIACVFCSFYSYSQSIKADSICKLESGLSESSGLLVINGKIYTHNDSGNKPEIYALDSSTGKIIETFHIKNAVNKDWEDICADDSFVYIGDFGNNQGTRKDLKIYRISKRELKQGKDTIDSETTFFSFADQTTFTSNQFQTNYDAEAMVSMGDSLYVFSKNWGDFKTRIYPIPKTPGAYVSTFVHSSNTQGMVTGAAYNPKEKIILLCGYSFTGEFLYKYSTFHALGFTPKKEVRFNLEHKGSSQIEGIAYDSNNTYLLSSEAFQSMDPILQKIQDIQLLQIHSIENKNVLYPNPVTNTLTIESDNYQSATIYGVQGNKILTTLSPVIDLSSFGLGQYFIYILQTDGTVIHSKFLKKE